MQQFAWDARTIAAKAGVSVQRVNNRLALLNLRDDLQHLVRTGNLSIGYAQVIAESELDKNRQLIALRRYQESPSPTIAWFRKVCGELSAAQAQGDLFGNDLFAAASFDAVQTVQKVEWKAPADPKTDKAPAVGASHRELIENQIQFWLTNGDKWDRYGKSLPRDRCLSAAKALQDVLQWMPKGRAKRVSIGSEKYVVYAV